MKNSKDLVSFIMSTYNSEDTVSKSIESMLSQTYKNIEILIIDDGSNDNTYKICESFSKKNNNIFLYRNNKNIGLTKSLNKLIVKSRGVYLARQDADDTSALNRIEKQFEFINANKLDGCGARANIMGESRVIPGLSYFFPIKFIMKYKNPFIHGTLLIKKDVLNEIGDYDERFIFSQDYKLMSDILKKGYKISILKTPLYNLNFKNNISIKFKKEQQYYANCVKRNLEPINLK
mgnify:CR=1 FL=1|tara:strand:- start:2011 stop:2712 length:702 start_codon:yes stop_codon:yes gene_type:complete